MSTAEATITVEIPESSAEERASRLRDAGVAWTKRVEDNPASAQLTYLVKGQAEGAVASRLTAGKHEFVIDEPAGLAGDDVAASPVEIALGALIACQVVVYRLYAEALGIQLDSISASAEGDLDVHGIFGFNPDVRPGFGAVRLNIRVTGPETAERYEELRAAVDAHCPVLDLFANPTPVSVSLSVG